MFVLLYIIVVFNLIVLGYKEKWRLLNIWIKNLFEF